MKNNLVKDVGGIILIVVTSSLAGCEDYKARQLTESEIKYRENYKTRYPIQVPEHMRGTLMDPFPPALRGYGAPELIR